MILITGGGGFLGKALAKALLARGEEVRSFSRGDYPELRQLGVEVMRGDVADPQAVRDAVAGCEAVCHVAAKAGIWGPYREYHQTNVVGTQNVIAACRAYGVKRLVYTSSPSVVFAGKDHQGIDERAPYPPRYLSHYQKTKAIAEQKIIGANSDALATVALRPHLIWGPGDNHLVPRLLARARAGQLMLVGDGANRVDSVYIDNAVLAHLNALDKLDIGSTISGKCYFISNGEPLPISELINKILAAADLAPVTKKIPLPLAYAVGATCELIYYLTGRQDEPRLTRFLALELARAHWYDLTNAHAELDYHPQVTIAEGMARLKEWLSEH